MHDLNGARWLAFSPRDQFLRSWVVRVIADASDGDYPAQLRASSQRNGREVTQCSLAGSIYPFAARSSLKIALTADRKIPGMPPYIPWFPLASRAPGDPSQRRDQPVARQKRQHHPALQAEAS